jgi:hypothetical protein
MDIQTRKLNLISYLSRLQDEELIKNIEKFILQKQEKNDELMPFTIDELIQRIERSESDFKKGDFKTQDELEKLSANW